MHNKIIFILSILGGIFLLASIFLFSDNLQLRGRLSEKKQEEAPANKNDSSIYDMPIGHTVDSYKVEKISTSTCVKNSDCQTPMEYLVQSRCPFTSLCLNNRCAVICPDYEGE